MLSSKPDPALAGPLYGKEPWPLRFHAHSFSARCMNTLACSIVYDRYQFGNRKAGIFGEPVDSPSGPPPENWKEYWTGTYGVRTEDERTFPGPVELDWVSLDGISHRASIDLETVFPERLVLHSLSREEVKAAWLECASVEPVAPQILVEVNDRSIRIYMRALIVTEAAQLPGNPRSHLRKDLMLAWEGSF